MIANRGEIVLRIARTARAMGIATAAVYSEPDADAPHVRACDEAVAIGGAAPGESYLRRDRLLDAARAVGADAVHPGYGFLAEDPQFATAVTEAGLTWVGPSPDAIAAMGDKLAAKATMGAAGVPVLASVAVDADTDLAGAGDEVGFPLLVKAAAGGGGKGMRLVTDPADLAQAVAAAGREAAGAFGDDRVFLERFAPRPRHVEIQILGDHHGHLLHLFERECSVQRRHQKVIEETPSPALDPGLRAAMGEAAVTAGRAIGYTNAGTVEFVLGASGRFAFLEVNTRLQVEHPVTELVVRVGPDARPLDLVRLQLLVAQGEPLPFTQDDLSQRGHAVEARLYAEDPASGYLPATGTLNAFAPGAQDAVRWDSGVESGSLVGPHYDPLLAKVIAHAPTRREAAAVLARALDTTLLHGVTTNRELLVAVLRHPAFLDGDTTTDFLDRHFPAPDDRRFPPSDHAVRLGAVVAALAGQARRQAERRFQGTIPPGWRNDGVGAQHITYRVDEREVAVTYRRDRVGTWRGTVDGRPWSARRFGVDLEVDGHRFRPRVSSVTLDRTEHHVVTPAGAVTLIEVPRFPPPARDEVSGARLAPMPGAVVEVAVAEGTAVARGDLLVVLEAMKMEHRISAPEDGTVTEVRVAAGDQVDAGAVLVVVEPAAERGS